MRGRTAARAQDPGQFVHAPADRACTNRIGVKIYFVGSRAYTTKPSAGAPTLWRTYRGVGPDSNSFSFSFINLWQETVKRKKDDLIFVDNQKFDATIFTFSIL